MHNVGTGQADLRVGDSELADGDEETAPSVVAEGSFNTVGRGVTTHLARELDPAGLPDDVYPVEDQRVRQLDEGPVVVDQMAALAASLQVLAEQEARSHDRARAQEEIVVRMQERITELQGDQVRALFGPVIHELAALHADVVAAGLHDFAAASSEKIAAEFAFIADRIEGSLTLLGLESVAAAEGDPFDAGRHLAGRAVPISDEGLDRTIAAVHRQGYTFPGAARTALFALVDVYRYDATLTDPAIQATAQRAASESTWAPNDVDLPGSSSNPTSSQPVLTTPNEGFL